MYSIDWEEQWRLHARNFKGDGFVHLDFPAKNIKLAPGPGFGDLSHPTTRLMLQVMEPRVAGKQIVDIGCGSGVLTLSSIGMGASSAIGIDIELDAVVHAQKNSLLNNLENKISFYHSDNYFVPNHWANCIVMNMITSEQKIAWKHYIDIFRDARELIVSGILVAEKEKYLLEVGQKGWRLSDSLEEGEWCAIHLLALQASQ